MAKTRIHLLGGFLIEHEGRTIAPIPSAIARSLFAYLATYRGRPHTRELLAGTFWPDQPESVARRRLSQAIWNIQTALQDVGGDEPILRATPFEVEFSTAAEPWLDIAAFDEHLASASAMAEISESAEIANLDAAVGLYRGEFLAGFYDDWTDIERQRLRIAYVDALDRLIALHKARADYATALSFARRLTLDDPLREDAHREIMRLCFLLGRTNEALQQYERCAAILSDELGTEPSTDTRALRYQITQMRAKGERPFAPTIEAPLLGSERRIGLVGREDERVAVLRRLEDALLGSGGTVLIEGQSGIGKTRLLQELAEDAQWRGLSALRADCREETELIPFQTVQLALRSGLSRLRAQQLSELLSVGVLSELGMLVPEIHEWLPELPIAKAGRSGVEPERYHRVLRRVLVALAELSPQVVFVDDTQWADEESMAVLSEVARDLEDHGLLLCLAYRGTEARERTQLWKHLIGLDSSTTTTRIELVPLGLQDTTQLIEESLGAVKIESDVADGLYLETGGNPLFVLETLRAWHEETRNRIGDDAQLTELLDSDQLPVAGGVSQVIARRFSGLDADARSVLEATAVFGRLGDAAAVAPVAGLSRLEALRAVEALLRRGALVETDAGYEFAHYQIRKVILDEIPPDRIRGLHAAVAEAIEQRQPERIEELAHHYSSAGVTGKAARFSSEAGHRALSLAAYDTAVRHFENALSWGVAEGKAEALAGLDDALEVLGRRGEQAEAIDRLDAEARAPQWQAEAKRRRARLLGHEGRYAEAVATAEAAIALPDLDAEQYARLLHTLGLLLSRAGRPAEAVSRFDEAARSLGDDPVAQAAVLSDFGAVLCELQEYGRAGDQLSRALERYEAAGDQFGIAEASGQLAIVRMEEGETAAAIELYQHALDRTRDIGYRRGEAVNLLNIGNALYVRGAIAEALERYDRAADVFATMGDRHGAAMVRANSASVRLTVLGDTSVEDSVRDALEFFTGAGHSAGAAFCHEHLAALAHRQGNVAAAREYIAQGLDLAGEGGHRWAIVHLRRLGASIELDAGDLEAAALHVEQARTLCAEIGLKDVAPTIESLAAVIRLRCGDEEQALELARAGTDLLEAGSEQPYVVWYRRYLVAVALGRTDEAAGAIQEAGRQLDAMAAALPEDLRAASLASVPEHLSIMEARERSVELVVSAYLPGSGVPVGRPVHDDEWVEVEWTVSAPGDFQLDDEGERRRHRLARLMEEAAAQGGAPRLEDLADALSVSVATVRRDIARMKRSGVQIVTRGSR